MGLASATPNDERCLCALRVPHMSFNFLELSSLNINLTGTDLVAPPIVAIEHAP
jgi:hypothetical protein